MATVRLHHETTGNKVTLQFSHHGKVARYSLPVKVLHHQWNATTQRIVQHPNANALNAILISTLARAQSALLEYCTNNLTRHMTAHQLRDIICSRLFGNSEQSLFACIFDQFCSTKNARTLELYQTTRRQMAASDKYFETRTFDEINLQWLQRFKEWCCAHSQATNTTNIRLRCIRAVFNYARKMEYTTAYPFAHEKIKNTDIIHRDLTNAQIELLITSPVPPELNESITACRLMFYLIGINGKDFYNLKPSDIHNNRAEYIRAKTHKSYSIFVQPEAAAIIGQYSNAVSIFAPSRHYTTHREYLRKLNEDLAIYCQLLNIPRITTNWLRHSWATYAWRIGIPIDTISLALGHSFGLAVTNGYILKDLSAADAANRKVLDTIKAAMSPP